MSNKANWQATEYGLEIGSYALEGNSLHWVRKDRGGVYNDIMHIAGKGWQDHDFAQFVSEWRKAMVMHGHAIDEAIFERTIRKVVKDNARRVATRIFERLDDEMHRPEIFEEGGFNIISCREMFARSDRIKPVLARVLA
ncbi:hypothetical protein [Ensifer sp. ZNC0028]|uniref:hypothetical protein n=1 Tax=Ensifer sp. ZNC0028 TaxID=1339236 RepID=UPI0005BB80D6|nr:hypothetical protein [Ensifer sp. ZNC0028]